MIGKSILHYKILEKLGEGGMGIVYLADDNKLKRQVAIKFLPGHIASNSDERKRFEIEAQAAAALNHPNIATIHAIEETDDELFLVMEYISGKHLKDYVGARHVMPLREAIDIAIQIAKGLQAAHKKGIVHRDIKSANIMSTEDSQIKIMDFGLAKFRGSVQLTQIGTTVGTAAYMSPEQARGEEADQRADIWSFGIVFYEMLTGHPPFKGEYEQALIYNLLNEPIVPVSELNPDIPLEINHILNKCLQKDKEQRYQTMDEVLSDLKQGSASDIKSAVSAEPIQTNSSGRRNTWIKWSVIVAAIVTLLLFTMFLFKPSAEQPGISKKMLVVLPFENLGNTEDEYFADGITAEITSRLSGLTGLGVIARSSAAHYKKSTKTLKQIAEELGIEYVLMGTVQWQTTGNKKRVRVNSELIQVHNATQIWSKPYDADFADAFQLQSNIAGQAAEALNLKLLSNEKKVLDEKLSDNAMAYDYYLRANNYYDRSYSKEDYDIAEQMYLRAIDLDPGFTAAYARLANLQVDNYWFYYDRSKGILQKARQNLEKAQSLDADHYLVREALGWYYYHGKLDYEPALKEFYASLESQPNNGGVHMGIASVLRRQGKMEKAIEAFKKATEVDPRNPLMLDQTGETLILVRKYDEAEHYFNKAISLNPDQGVLYVWKAWVYLARDKDPAAARKILQANTYEIKYEIALQFYTRLLIETAEGKYEAALELCRELDGVDDQFYFYPQSLLLAKYYRFLKNEKEALQNYKLALDIINQKISETPDDPRFYSTLGLIYAGLGQKEEAIEAGERAVELMPVEMEAWRGGWRLYNLAEIYLKAGENEKALKLLDKVLSIPLDISINIIELDPTWDALKELPEYKRLQKKYAVGG